MLLVTARGRTRFYHVWVPVYRVNTIGGEICKSIYLCVVLYLHRKGCNVSQKYAQCSLHEELWGVAKLIGKTVCKLFKHFNEFPSDDFSLLFRIGYAFEASEESAGLKAGGLSLRTNGTSLPLLDINIIRL